MNYYKVLAKCGHVGKNYYILKNFFIEAEDGEDAARIIRYKPRVKHNHKDAIKNVTPITSYEYEKGIEEYLDDAYFHVDNKKDQWLLKAVKEDEIYREAEAKKKYKKRRNGQRVRYLFMTKRDKYRAGRRR